MSTKIEWTDEVWNPVTGCTKVSAGCKNCYAERIAERFWGERKFTDVQMHPERLEIPLHWKQPRRIFVNSMSDLFHEDVSVEFIAGVFNIMASWQLVCRKTNCEHEDERCWRDPGHIFQILTKRPERMWEVMTNDLPYHVGDYWPGDSAISLAMEVSWPLPNVWLGVSAEDQKTADERIPLLLQTPAAIRFVSLEPLLGPINELNYWFDIYRDNAPIKSFIDWVIGGGESGPHARPMHPDWVRSIRDQCVAAGVPFFFKQWGEWTLYAERDGPIYDRVGKKAAGRLLDGREWNDYPEAK